MTFTRPQNCLMAHFSGCIPVVTSFPLFLLYEYPSLRLSPLHVTFVPSSLSFGIRNKDNYTRLLNGSSAQPCLESKLDADIRKIVPNHKYDHVTYLLKKLQRVLNAFRMNLNSWSRSLSSDQAIPFTVNFLNLCSYPWSLHLEWSLVHLWGVPFKAVYVPTFPLSEMLFPVLLLRYNLS